MLYPLSSKTKEGNYDKVQIKFLTESRELMLDREKCTGCTVCVRVCPKQAFTKYRPEGPTKFFGKQVIFKKKKYHVPFIYDPKTCVYCGLCTYMCPFDSLRLNVNGEIIPPKNIQLVQSKAVPKLETEIVKLESGKEAKVYTKGSITIDINMCNTGCKNCAEICPTGAISVKPDIISKNKNEWEQDLKIEIYESKCITCGACHAICPTGALRLTIDEVLYSGTYNSPFWDDVIERLKIKPE
ncbi:MAG: 4Fe-4S binding protein [Promethearchaeota archaeon]